MSGSAKPEYVSVKSSLALVPYNEPTHSHSQEQSGALKVFLVREIRLISIMLKNWKKRNATRRSPTKNASKNGKCTYRGAFLIVNSQE